LRDDQDAIIGYLLIGTEIPRASGPKSSAEGGGLAAAIFNSANFSSIRHRREGRHSNLSMSAPSACWATPPPDVVNKITPADISDRQEMIARRWP